MRRRLLRATGASTACLLAGCAGVQSALSPAGVEGAEIARLTGWLFGGAAVIWVGVIALAVYASRSARASAIENPNERASLSDASKRRETRHARKLIIGGGVIFPVVTLTVLLVFGLRMTPPLLAADSDYVIEVTGEQWWWRVRYLVPDTNGGVDTANEIRLPVGRRTAFRLQAADVIHSFWIPVLGGKVDMIPGRETQLAVEPTAAGRYRGVCAEFCGASHALMAFDVVVMEQQSFDEWLRLQAQDAAPPATSDAERGQRLFLDQGCGACHQIRGTPAFGAVGPDLTHVGSRLSIGAGTLPLDRQAIEDWVARSVLLKPEVEMPPYHMLAADDLAAIAGYLAGLE